MTAPQIGVFQDEGGAVFNAAAYGAVGDARPLAGISGTAGSSTITVSGGDLPSAADIGKVILIPLAAQTVWSHQPTSSSPGGTGTPSPTKGTPLLGTLATTITGVSGTSVTLDAEITATVSDVTGLYGSDAAAQIGAALRAAKRAGGGTVYIPVGTYLIYSATLSLSSQVNLQGAGAGTRLVLAGTNTVVSMVGVRGCTVSELEIDLFDTANFTTAISIGCGSGSTPRWSEDIRVERCSLINSLWRHCQGVETLHAVVLAGCRRVWITGCFTQGVELKCALGPGVSAVQVTGNTIVNPLQYGVSFATTGGTVTDCIVANNVIQDVSQQAAIYAGDDDAAGADVVCERLTIVGNVISGVPSKLGFFIQLRIPPQARDWIVKDNVIRVERGTTCGVSGIYVAPRGAPTAVIQNLVISGNVVAGTDQPGIYLDASRGDAGVAKTTSCVPGPPKTAQPQGSGFLIQGNVLERTGGIAVVSQYNPQPAYWDGRIAGNVVRGGSIALLNGGPVDICDNLVDTTTTPVAVATAAGFGAPLMVVGAAIVLGAAAPGSRVTSMVCNNRIRNGTSGTGIVNGIREAGDPDAAFDVVYSGNLISDNTGVPILTMRAANGPPSRLQGLVISDAGAPAGGS